MAARASQPRPDASPPDAADLLGQEPALRAFTASITGGRVAGAYLLHGPLGVGRAIGAAVFGAALLCEGPSGLLRCGTCRACRWNDLGSHPDFFSVTADRGPRLDDDADAERATPQEFTRAARAATDAMPRRTIPVRTLRRLMELLSLAPAGGGARAVVIDSFDEIEEEGAAALLKTVEEAPPRTTFLLLARGLDSVPDTILSRCQRIRFQPLAPDVVRRILKARGGDAARSLDEGSLDLVVRLAQGSAGRALRGLASGLHDRAAPAARGMLRGESAAEDAALSWMKEGGRDLDTQRERAREMAALLLLFVRDGLVSDPSSYDAEVRVNAVRSALVSVDSNVSPELAMRSLCARLAQLRPTSQRR